MRYCILASGSKGNSTFIETNYARILVDVGLSAKKIEDRLKKLKIEPESIDSIVLTHAHADHVRGVGQFAYKFKVPIYAHPETLDEITSQLKPAQRIEAWQGEFYIKDACFTPFHLSHDCDPTFGYLIRENSKVLGICTDLGVGTENVKEHLRKSSALILESNHDPVMLMGGTYPWRLKERIASRVGHLSNIEAGELIQEILNSSMEKIILAHLSEDNNTAQIALDTVLEAVGDQLESVIGVIEQRRMSDMFEL
jgi:phosphoribosyl 1,2-cyclic phosphodiesterase